MVVNHKASVNAPAMPLARHPWFDADKGWIGPAEFETRDFFLAYADATFRGDDWLLALVILKDFLKFPCAGEAYGGRPVGPTGLPQEQVAEIRSAVLGV